ncbi:MAG: 6-carboxytetrahydropterin synthase QueD [Bdellovibrionaceae bacterium]|jgi:6-pyruvoyltetrahydropterin/6-carboxytetrahydropterin synthase|nr:6-carboxytetrahydropterin synthase QueD [Pseudobdellovibrionaceae bacterium]
MIEIKKSFEIESARFLPNLPKSHPCSQTHGHSFKITLKLQGKMDEKLGWLIDYNDIAKAAGPTLKKIDHKLLNKVEGLNNPTTENITIWLYKKLKKQLPNLVQVIIKETSDTECSYPSIP